MNLVNKQFDENELSGLPRYRFSIRAQILLALRLIKRAGSKLLITNNYMQKGKVFIALAIAIVLVFGGLTAYASSSVAVTVKSPLFGLKTSVESLKLALASDGIATVRVHLENAQHRLAEAKYLVAVNDYNGVSRLISTAYADDGGSASAIEDSLTSMVASTDAAISETESMTSPVEATAALSEIDEVQSSQSAELIQLAAETEDENEAANEVILETIGVTDENNQAVAEESEIMTAAAIAGEKDVEVDIETVSDEEKTNKPTAADLTAQLEAQKASFVVTIAESGVSAEDSAKLVERVGAMQAKVADAIAAGNLNKASGLLKASKALQNNLKHFTKKAVTEKAKEELKNVIEKEKEGLKAAREQKREDIKAKSDEIKKELKKLDGSKKEKREKIKEMIKNVRELRSESRDELRNLMDESRDRIEQKREEFRSEIRNSNTEEESESVIED